MQKVFKDYVNFKLYDVDYQVCFKIEEDNVTVIVVSKDLYKPLVFFDIEDYIQQFSSHLQGIWKQKMNGMPCKEIVKALNIVNNQFIYCFAVLMDNLKQQGYDRQQFKKKYPIAYKRVVNYFAN